METPITQAMYYVDVTEICSIIYPIVFIEIEDSPINNTLITTTITSTALLHN